MFGLFQKKKYEDLYGADFEKKMNADKGTVVLDVRTNGEFRSGHIPGAKNVDIMNRDFTRQIATLDKSKTYLIYCRSGSRSAQACSLLSANGYKVYNLAGGIMRWSGVLV